MGQFLERRSGNPEEHLFTLKPEQKIKQVKEIVDTVDQENVRLGWRVGESKPYVAWGVVWLEGLPYCFTAYNLLLTPKKIDFLEDTEKRGVSTWNSIYVPSPAHEYAPAAIAQPALSDKEKSGIVKRMKEGSGDFFEVLSKKDEAYREFIAEYRSNPMVSSRYAAAIQMICNARENSEKQ